MEFRNGPLVNVMIKNPYGMGYNDDQPLGRKFYSRSKEKHNDQETWGALTSSDIAWGNYQRLKASLTCVARSRLHFIPITGQVSSFPEAIITWLQLSHTSLIL